MPWSTPITWVTGDLVTSGRLNAMLADNLNWLKGNGADGRVNYRMSGTVPGIAPSTPRVTNTALGYFGTIIWDATGFIDTILPGGGGTPPWGYVPEPSGVNLLVARANTITGGTLSNAVQFQSDTGEVPGSTTGTVPITGYQLAACCLHRYTGNLMRVYAWHGGASGSVQGIGLALDLHQMVTVA